MTAETKFANDKKTVSLGKQQGGIQQAAHKTPKVERKTQDLMGKIYKYLDSRQSN